jgi:integrase
MRVALDENPVENDTDRHRREISVDEMREFIRNTTTIQTLAVVLMFAKTGMRLGELTNLDLRDLYIDHDGARRVLPKPRPELTGKPDSIFVDSNISKGDIVNGVKRRESNKRKRDTIIPIDDELKRGVLYWISARPPSPTVASPLFSHEKGYGSGSAIGLRATQDSISQVLRRRTKQYGWYEKGGRVQNNVTPHYFRHFFTTHMRNRVGDRGVVKYIRGDTGNDIVDLYTHNWNGNVREVYLDNIYNLLSE